MEHHEHSTDHQGAPHVISYARYIMIWFGLVMLTGTTVALAGMDLGRWIIVTALTIASIKTTLVLGIFMHLKFEDRMYRLFVLIAGATFAIFISLTFFDYAFR
jgi:cytochrome c oxidase subunit IV